MNIPDPDLTPVVIVGAGPVGLPTALGLARQGVQGTILEQEQTTTAFPMLRKSASGRGEIC